MWAWPCWYPCALCGEFRRGRQISQPPQGVKRREAWKRPLLAHRLVDRPGADGMGVERRITQDSAGDIDVALRRLLAGRADLAQIGDFLRARIALGVPAHQGRTVGFDRIDAEPADVRDL